MILFCEDCGKKNYLDRSPASHGVIEFRCVACHYPNRISLNTIPVRLSDKTDVFFTHLKAIPEVVGAFLYHIHKGVIINQMPDILKPNDIVFLGKSLVKSYKIASFLYPDITQMTLAIEQRNLILKMLNTDLSLVISCEQFPVSETIQGMLTPDNLSIIRPKL